MKTFLSWTLFLGLTVSPAFADSLNDKALETLLASKETTVVGDVRAHETVSSIYNHAIESKAAIRNVCRPLNSEIANCILWITFGPIGETALVYQVFIPGDKLTSNIVDVARGD